MEDIRSENRRLTADVRVRHVSFIRREKEIRWKRALGEWLEFYFFFDWKQATCRIRMVGSLDTFNAEAEKWVKSAQF